MLDEHPCGLVAAVLESWAQGRQIISFKPIALPTGHGHAKDMQQRTASGQFGPNPYFHTAPGGTKGKVEHKEIVLSSS